MYSVAMTTRTRLTATYYYPGAFMPETTEKTIEVPDSSTMFEAVAANQPDEAHGYFRRDGWYAATLVLATEKRYVADDGDEVWIAQERRQIGSWLIGTSDAEGTVTTRRGNRQWADQWDHLVKPDDPTLLCGR